MRIVALLAVGLMCGTAGAAHADHAPVLVVPGRPGVPVVINGYDASYTVVEGDFGLSRPGHMAPVIVGGPLVLPAPYYTGPYFPALGRRPGYGRREIEPPPDRRRPRPGPSYHREWGVQSQPLPADVPAYSPPVIEASPFVDMSNEGHGRPDRHAGHDGHDRHDRHHHHRPHHDRAHRNGRHDRRHRLRRPHR